MSVTELKPAGLSLNATARAAMTGAATYREGAERLLATARGDSDLMAALMEPYEINAALDAVQKAVSDTRRVIWEAPNRESDAARVEALIAGNMMLLDFPLPGGMALRFATKAEVQGAAGFYQTQAADMSHKSRWLVKVARRVPAGKTVGDALKNEDLEKMQKDTGNG